MIELIKELFMILLYTTGSLILISIIVDLLVGIYKKRYTKKVLEGELEGLKRLEDYFIKILLEEVEKDKEKVLKKSEKVLKKK